MDDRYWCHYIGHSVLRALLLLETRSRDILSQSVAGTSCSQQTAAPVSPLPPITDSSFIASAAKNHRSPITSFKASGHALLTSPSGACALVSTRKGGIVTATWPSGARASDFGWLVTSGKSLLVTHWWSNDWETDVTEATATTEGWLVPHKEHTSEPWKHILLRIASFLLGRHLIAILKRLVIFKKPVRTHHLKRTVTWDGDTLVITDTLTGLTETDTLTRAPRTSKRHVASADSYHPEDLAMLQHIERTEENTRTKGVLTSKTKYHAP